MLASRRTSLQKKAKVRIAEQEKTPQKNASKLAVKSYSNLKPIALTSTPML